MTPGRTVGRPSGEAGFTLIDLLFVCGLVGLLSTLAVPGLTRARGAAQASSALAGLRVINSAELSYAISCGAGFYAPDLPTLGVAPPGSPAAFLSVDMSSAPTVNKSGFQFRLAGTPLAGSPASCNGLAAGQGAPGYKAVADPLEPPVTRFFGTNASGLIYESTASLWATMPENGPLAGGQLVQ
ncbi:MAG TPA: type II secretion system protein [Vicinamibacterales bacterium]|nr:type II secretion system protein [Vicinamibacterales bacterium]